MYEYIYAIVCIHTHAYIHTHTHTQAQLLKNPPIMPETWIPSLGWEDPLEKGKATHYSVLA